MIGFDAPRARRLGVGLAVLWAVSGCEAQQPFDAAPVEAAADEVFGSLPPSSATIAMRWQWLNPEVNSFTFRNTQNVFAFRTVEAPANTWELPQADGFAMPAAMVAGEDADYAAWADRTFTNAFIVLRDGEVVFEDYRNRMTAETPHIAFSMSKTLTAMLVGQALENGEIVSLDDPVSTYLPQLADGGYRQATIRNLLEMRSGADIMERYDFGDNPSLAGLIHQTAIVENRARFADFAVDVGSRSEPGAEFNYATLDTAVLGWMLEEVTGQKVEDLMESRIWQPMGAEFDGHFLADGPVGEGRALNGMGFNASLRDYARLGQLMLDGGMAGDTRILPEGWVEQMASMRPTGGPLPGYGLQTWQVDDEPGAFAAVGLGGQYIYVHPASGTVIAKLSYNPPAEPEWLNDEVLGYFGRVVNTP